MTVACRFPDRVDGCISVDASPADESKNPEYRAFTWSVVSNTFLSLIGLIHEQAQTGKSTSG